MNTSSFFLYLNDMKRNAISTNLVVFLTFGLLAVLSGCGSAKESLSISDQEKLAFASEHDEPVNISNDEVEYEIIIIDLGFDTWLNSIARPEGYYSQNFLENRNRILVMEWNQRALQPLQFNPDLYLMQIDYQQNIDYGYEVNYKLYNYFVFFQRKYNQRLGPFLPRI